MYNPYLLNANNQIAFFSSFFFFLAFFSLFFFFLFSFKVVLITISYLRTTNYILAVTVNIIAFN